MNINASVAVMLSLMFRTSAFAFGTTSRFATRRVGTAAYERASSSSSSSTGGDPSPTTPVPAVADGDLSAYENRNNIDDQVFSAMSGCGGVKVTCATMRNLVNDSIQMHRMEAVPADALARSVTCGLLLSNGMPDAHTVQITTACDGPLIKVVSVVTGDGKVKGYVQSPNIKGFGLKEAIGRGTVQVVKNHPDWPNPYNGITAIRNGEIDRDVGVYLAESEQRTCAVAAASSIEGILCHSAGGYLIEQLPGCADETMAKVKENLNTLVQKDGGKDLPSNLLRNGCTPLEMAGMLLEDLDMRPLQQITPQLDCPCGEDRLLRALYLLPEDDVRSIIDSQEVIEAKCEFCDKTFCMQPSEVERALAAAREQNL